MLGRINVDSVKRLVSGAYVHRVVDAFGEEGETALEELLDTIKLVFEGFPPENLTQALTIMRPIDPGEDEIECMWNRAERVTNPTKIGEWLRDLPDGKYPLILLGPDRSMRTTSSNVEPDPAALARSSIVYRYHDRLDRILARTHDVAVEKVVPEFASNFANPAFDDLDEALDYYASIAEESRCFLLEDVWEGGVDGPRLVLVNKPERIMRKSLSQMLAIVLRNASVRPEQNTDESKPVDIRVEWSASSSSSLIEIKWLGCATAKPRKESNEETYTRYDANRAVRGANQLADYLDRERRFSRATALKGHLVVFDARRNHDRSDPHTLLEAECALRFARQEIEYSPDHSESRSDFAPPRRFFLRPRQSHFVATA